MVLPKTALPLRINIYAAFHQLMSQLSLLTCSQLLGEGSLTPPVHWPHARLHLASQCDNGDPRLSPVLTSWSPR